MDMGAFAAAVGNLLPRIGSGNFLECDLLSIFLVNEVEYRSKRKKKGEKKKGKKLKCD